MPESDRSWQQQQSQQMSVKRPDKRQHSLPQTQLQTEEGILTPVQRVHIRGEDPQPNIEVPIVQQPAVRKPVVLKKIITRQPLRELHPNGQHHTTDSEHRDPIPSPTMPCHPWKTQRRTHIIFRKPCSPEPPKTTDAGRLSHNKQIRRRYQMCRGPRQRLGFTTTPGRQQKPKVHISLKGRT